MVSWVVPHSGRSGNSTMMMIIAQSYGRALLCVRCLKPHSSLLEEFEAGRCWLCSECLLGFSCEAIWSWTFGSFYIVLQFHCLWLICSYFLVQSNPSKNLSISSRLSILLACRCSSCYGPFCLEGLVVTFFCLFFISDFIDLERKGSHSVVSDSLWPCGL